MHILTGNEDVPHREWGYASPGMHILTGNAYSLYRVESNLEELEPVKNNRTYSVRFVRVSSQGKDNALSSYKN